MASDDWAKLGHFWLWDRNLEALVGDGLIWDFMQMSLQRALLWGEAVHMCVSRSQRRGGPRRKSGCWVLVPIRAAELSSPGYCEVPSPRFHFWRLNDP